MEKKFILVLIIVSISILTYSQLQFKYIASDSNSYVTYGDDTIRGQDYPRFIIDCDSIFFELDNRALSKVDPDWIKSLSVQKGDNVPEKYLLYKGHTLIIIKPFMNSRKDFWALKTGSELNPIID